MVVGANRRGGVKEEKGRHNSVKEKEGAWGGGEGRKVVVLWEGRVLFKVPVGTPHILVIVKSYQLTMRHQGIRG